MIGQLNTKKLEFFAINVEHQGPIFFGSPNCFSSFPAVRFVLMTLSNIHTSSTWKWNAISELQRALGCVCLQLAPANEEYITMEIEERLRGSQLEERAYYGVGCLNSIYSRVNVLRSNIATMPFTDKLPRPLHRFNHTRYITAGGVQITSSPIFQTILQIKI